MQNSGCSNCTKQYTVVSPMSRLMREVAPGRGDGALLPYVAVSLALLSQEREAIILRPGTGWSIQ